MGNRLIKVLVGQRRAGKSYLLRQVAQRLVEDGVKAENTLIINRELSDFDFLVTHQDLDELLRLYKSELKSEGKVYVFIKSFGYDTVVFIYSTLYLQPV